MNTSTTAASGLDGRQLHAEALGRLAQLHADWEGDWCGTPPKRFPPKKHHFEGLEEVFDGSLRWTPALQATQMQLNVALNLYRAGQQLAGMKGPVGETGQAMTRSAVMYFGDGYCGSVPLSVLIQILLHGGKNPPPPPPDWLRETMFDVQQIRLAARMDGNAGSAIQQAAVQSITQRFSF